MYNSLSVIITCSSSAKECPLPERVASANQVGSGTSYGTIITYTCTGSKRFEDGSIVKHVECLGYWTETNLTCEGAIRIFDKD